MSSANVAVVYADQTHTHTTLDGIVIIIRILVVVGDPAHDSAMMIRR